MQPATEHERYKVLALVERHGWNATAFQTLETGYRYFFYGEDACVAYVATRSAWVAGGAPIASAEQLGQVTEAFLSAARAAGKRACFFASEERLQSATHGALRALRIGEQPVWDPREWKDKLKQARSLREQLRRARAKRVRTRELTAEEIAGGSTHQAMQRVIERWLSTRALAPMGFLVHLEPFTFPAHRRCFVAEIDGRLQGFAAVVPVPQRNGWFLEDLVRDPGAPNGTSELLIDAVMQWAAEQGSSWLTLGLAPLAGDVAPPLQAVRKTTGMFYDFDGLRAYKAKLRPSLWSPIYLAYPPTQSGFASIVDSLVAFTRGGFLRFAMRCLLRGPRAVLRVLTILLVPWTLLLMLAPAERWFWRPELKWAWVLFDLLVLAGLLRLLRKPQTSLLTALATAVTCDAVLTPLQAALWNLPRAHNVVDYAAIVAACAAPLLATITLWGARRHRLG